MSIETIEITVLPHEIIKLKSLPRMLRDYFYTIRTAIRNYNILLTYDNYNLWSHKKRKVPYTDLTYRQPRRGDLSALAKWKEVSNYRSGVVWIYLGKIVCEIARLHCKSGLPKLTFTNVNDAFLTYDGWMRDIMMNLAAVCKEWRVVLKHHCIWWGPARRYFALC